MMKLNLRRMWLLQVLRLLSCGYVAERSLGSAAAADATSGAPTILKQPADVVGKRLGSVTFEVVASGSKPITYQWHRDGKTWAGWTKRTLTLEGVSENDIGTYTVTISNPAGSITSEGARFTLVGSPSPPPQKPPAASKPAATPPAAKAPSSSTLPPQPPAAEDAIVGQSVKFGATADGSPPFKFQWLKNGQPISGATTGLFAIEHARPEDAGLYVCIVSNSAGSSPSAPINLVVRKP